MEKVTSQQVTTKKSPQVKMQNCRASSSGYTWGSGNIVGEGRKDSKSWGVREFAVRLHLLGMSEATP